MFKNLNFDSTVLIAIVVICVLLYFRFSSNQSRLWGKLNTVEHYDSLPSNDVKILYFYTTWCGYCNKFKSTWEKLYNDPKYTKFMHKIDCDDPKYAKIVDKFGISSYPTIVYSPNGIRDNVGSIDYNGNMEMQSVKKFICDNCL